jgi:V/A-type H+-transporting ATPase subunit F
MNKIIFIGQKYLIAPLELLGIETLPAENGTEALSALNTAIAKSTSALIFMTETVGLDLEKEIETFNRRPEINIVLIPDNRGSLGLGRVKINKLITNSIGAEVNLRK